MDHQEEDHHQVIHRVGLLKCGMVIHVFQGERLHLEEDHQVTAFHQAHQDMEDHHMEDQDAVTSLHVIRHVTEDTMEIVVVNVGIPFQVNALTA